PIGRPIANTQIYILDQHLQAVPAGISGELYVGGIGVTQGYLNRPDLTEERFIPDPFSQAAGAKLYKTGDLARYRPDGLIDFLGRADHQVKIRGYRIEPDEIRERILQQDGISEAVVVARAEANHPKFQEGSSTVDELAKALESFPQEQAEHFLRIVEMLPEEALESLLSEPKNSPSV
ncbi:MAG: AMP-binding protein, partial [Bacteroidota bacterium]